jgi:hypothetical protein
MRLTLIVGLLGLVAVLILAAACGSLVPIVDDGASVTQGQWVLAAIMLTASVGISAIDARYWRFLYRNYRRR